MKPFDNDRGVTLAEMLVVLAIIAVMAGVATLSVGAVDRTVGAEAEARRLAAAMSLAADQASVDRRARVVTWSTGAWRVGGVEHELPSGLRLQADRIGETVTISPDGAGDPTDFTVEGVDRWRVRFDGLSAVASRAGAES